MIDLVQALEYVDVGRKADFYFAARSLLTRRREDLALFDEAFEVFWRAPRGERTRLDLRALGEKRRFRRPRFAPPPLRPPENPRSRDDPPRGDEPPPVLHVTLTYSPDEVLRHKDFAELTAEEAESMKQLMAALTWRLGERRSRRLRRGRGRLPDLRRTWRGSLRYGGEVLHWEQREPKTKPRPLVVIADVSGSMESYTRLLLQFAYGLTAGLDTSVEAFVFSTRLTRITRELRARDLEGALQRVAHTVPDWSGGTRIGDALKTFNFQWARRVLGRGAVVLLISDGWDRGDIDMLRAEAARLQRSCYRLIWLNPLLGMQNYEPLTLGLKAALPYVDEFLPVHNLASLEELATRLEALDARAGGRSRRRIPPRAALWRSTP